jgi:hypothetical protein
MTWEREQAPGVTGGPYGQPGQRGKTRRQFHALPDVRIASFDGIDGTTGGEFQLRIATPSGQVRVLISVDFEPAAGQPDDLDITGLGDTIWLAATNEGSGGATTQDIPNSSVEGMRSAPTPFPSTRIAGVVTLDNGLLGYAREFVTASPWITGIVTLAAGGEGGPSPPGTWLLKVSYQPDGVVLPDDAWRDIVAMCTSSAFRL